MKSERNRRAVLSELGAGMVLPLAGCSQLSQFFNPDVVVFNRTDSEQTAEITLTAGTDVLISERTSIEASEAFEQDDVLSSSGTVTFDVTVEDGPSAEREFDISDDTSLQAYIDGEIEFEKF